MSRLASLTPSRARSSPSPSPHPSPAASLPDTPRSKRYAETTYHRMVKLLISELRALFKTWDDLVLVDGMKAGKGCIDEATEMDNLLALEESDERPSIVSHLERLYASRSAMTATLTKLDKSLVKFSLLLDQSEKIYFEAYRTQPYEFLTEEPLWTTWTLEHFVNSLPPLLTLHHRHLVTLQQLSQTITDPETEFDDAKLALEKWRDVGVGGARYLAVREWEELVELELSGGGGMEVEEEEEFGGGGRGKVKKKGKR